MSNPELPAGRVLSKTRVMKLQLFKLTVACTFLLTLAPFAGSASSTLDHGSVTPAGTYRGMLELQAAGGVNLVARVDMGLTAATGVRALLGTGATALQWGLYYKWVPIPDYGKQPSIGLLGGFTFTHNENKSAVTFRAHPMLSKRLDSEIGDIIPYVAVPIGLRIVDGRTYIPVQLALGAEVQPTNLKNFTFWIEGGVNVANADGYVSLAASHPF
ncbi:MAG: hypothetical protein K2X47_05645 [Bdellovibrionales bacterium]|nr:hypothetical protein [Bdellovibrionales bacterium]